MDLTRHRVGYPSRPIPMALPPTPFLWESKAREEKVAQRSWELVAVVISRRVGTRKSRTLRNRMAEYPMVIQYTLLGAIENRRR